MSSVNWFIGAVPRYWGCMTSIAPKHFSHMSHLKVTLGSPLYMAVTLGSPLYMKIKYMKNIARIAKRCPSKIASVVNVSSCLYLKMSLLLPSLLSLLLVSLLLQSLLLPSLFYHHYYYCHYYYCHYYYCRYDYCLYHYCRH